MGVGVVNCTSNIDLIIRTCYLNTLIMELAKGVQIIEVGLYHTFSKNLAPKIILFGLC